MSYKPQISTDMGQSFRSDSLVFATEAEALANAKDLCGRWTVCTDYRVEESTDPVTHAWTDGVLTGVAEEEA